MPELEDADLLLGWSPAEAANRSLQAVYGFVTFAAAGGPNKLLDALAKDTLEWLERVGTDADLDYIGIVRENRLAFMDLLPRAKKLLFSAGSERLWLLFMERYDIRTGKLRANVPDILQCFDLQELGRLLGQPVSYFKHLPPSSELVLGPWGTGLCADLVIPPRLLVLDMILMLQHARHEHHKLEASFERQSRQLKANGRIDSYARQTLILAASVCDNVLTEYGYVVESALRSLSAPPDIIENVVSIQNKGVTIRLQKAPRIWNDSLNRPSGTPGAFLNDMVSLIEVRNRLVHPDGRLNCWYAFQVTPMGAQGWHFSERLCSYVDRPVSYRIPQSNIGYEFCLAHFCVDTVLLTIDFIHNIVYPNENRAPWLNLPRTADGALDLDAAVQGEGLLQL